ncbi:hypothetical protein MMC31_004455, partial [Peltigera leucophlebia]|nr:hypothetical protein [Peltigera leucophlebia]
MHSRVLDSTDTIDANTPNTSTHITSTPGPNTTATGTSTSISNPKTPGTKTRNISTFNANTLDTSISPTSTLSTSILGTSTSKTSIFAPPVLAAPVQVPPEQVTLVYALLAQVPPIQALGAGIFKKEASKSITLAKKTITPNKDVTSEEVLSSIQVFNSRFVNEIKDLRIEIDFHIWPPLKTLSLTGISSDSVVKLTLYHLHYKEKLEITDAAQIATQIVEISPDNIALPNKRFQWQISNKSRGLRYFKLGQDILSVLAV